LTDPPIAGIIFLVVRCLFTKKKKKKKKKTNYRTLDLTTNKFDRRNGGASIKQILFVTPCISCPIGC